MRIHIIAIGGSIMHNLAIALQNEGHEVTGSDDEIYSPAKEKLELYNLLPKVGGWNSDVITKDIDTVIVGMHAKANNPELLRAEELKIPIYSFPEYLYQHAKDKKRIVIAGSHGKTTTTAMVMHILKENNIDFDYIVGSNINGFDLSVRLSNAPIMIFEGDEYLSSPLDLRPKFIHYKPHVAVITGIAWDHINVFPTFEIYTQQFRNLIDVMEKNGKIFYFGKDDVLKEIVKNNQRQDIEFEPYEELKHQIINNVAYFSEEYGKRSAKIVGKHNFENMAAAMLICKDLGLENEAIIQSLSTFEGAGKRLQYLGEFSGIKVWKDFAHSPSKVKASCDAIHSISTNRKFIACLELHTFSSLNHDFLPQYHNTLQKADIALV
ncbi:MAG: hypothetical protein KBA06_06585, partial [Saprospiraceae bacterium]|nr:hypothetical protein [Saprospiraceae bacterium]